MNGSCLVPHSPALVLLLGAAAALLLGMHTVAYAQATVVVQVRRQGEPVDATVTLTPGAGGQPKSCRTQGGTCKMAGIKGGQYTVIANPNDGGRPAAPRPVMIPPSGETTLFVSLPEANGDS